MPYISIPLIYLKFYHISNFEPDFEGEKSK